MDPKKICFISCVSDDEHEKRLLENLSSLNAPDDYVLDFLGIRDVPSICHGYNEAMEASDAKYKVFMRQEARIENPDFLFDTLRLFKDDRIGAIGFEGTDKLPCDMVIEHGFLYGPDPDKNVSIDGEYKEVQVIKGDVIVTQTDFRWDEDLPEAWDFHELSVCAAMKKKGLKLIVPNQGASSWISCGYLKNIDENYEKNRLSAKEKYSKTFGISSRTKRIGIMSFNEIDGGDFLIGLLMSGNDVELIPKAFSVYSNLESDANKTEQYIREHHLDAVMSFVFCPAVSDACLRCGAKYIAWAYDAPLQTLFEKQIKNECNYIFSFDLEQVNETRNAGAENVFHQPLATNFAGLRFDENNASAKAKYGCDVSFVGSLYWEPLFDKVRERLPQNAAQEYESIIEKAHGIWDGTDRIYKRLSPETISELMKLFSSEVIDNLKMDYDYYCVSRLLGRELAFNERREMCRRLSEFDFRLYGGSEGIQLDGVKTYPRVGYDTDLPLVYRYSRINIGSTLHTIRSGIPMRVLDIMGTGGFLLTNYQPEIPQLFKVGQEIEVYHDFDEMIDKVRFYLKNENARQKIAASGYNAVRSKYTYEKQIRNILSVCKLM